MSPNRLFEASSPYLRRHAHDPVDWRPWGEAAAREAVASGRPVFLTVGFAACPACGAQRELFANAHVAAFLNERFVPVLVDREERPDVDALAMAALLAIQGEAGWPATLFLHPDLRPFTGATGLGGEGLPALQEVLARVDHLWRTDRPALEAASHHLRRALLGGSSPARQQDPVAALLRAHDAARGGFGAGARFPHPCENGLLLTVAASGDEPASRAVRRTLDAMADGALRDAVAGGFFRATVDPDWTRPRLEKLLSDQAQLTRLYVRASRVFAGRGRLGTQASRRDVEVARETARYLWRDLLHPGGGFCSAEALDDLGSEARPGDRAGRERLDEERRARAAARRTDTRVVAWNGLALGALAEAGRLLGADDWIALAARTAELLLGSRRADGRLPRVVGGDTPGFLADHAAVAEGLLALYQARPHEPRWLVAALELTRTALAAFRAEDGSFADSDAPELPFQLRRFRDDAEPSPNGLMAEVLRHLTTLGAMPPALLDALLTAAAPALREAPEATATLHAVALARSAPFLVIAGPPSHPTTLQMLRVWDRTWRPGGIVGLATAAPELEGFPALRVPTGSAPRAFLRLGGVDLPPIDDADALAQALS